MGRFNTFTEQERKVMREAMRWSSPEFFDPGHTTEDREALRMLIDEVESEERQHTKAPQEAPKSLREAFMAATPRETRKQKAPAQQPQRAATRGTTQRPTDQPRRRYDPHNPGECRGFLYIKCEHCGKIHAFCAKTPIVSYRCAECGKWTALTDMYWMHVNCECGKRYSYKTNVETPAMDVTCLNCQAPVAVEFNEKTETYETITNGAPMRGRRKK